MSVSQSVRVQLASLTPEHGLLAAVAAARQQQQRRARARVVPPVVAAAAVLPRAAARAVRRHVRAPRAVVLGALRHEHVAVTEAALRQRRQQHTIV